MSLQDTLFTFGLLFAAVVVAVAVGGAVYLTVRNRRIRRETGREVGTADPTVVRARDEPAESCTKRAAPPRREFYKSMGLETDEDMKVRLYSLEQYQDELGGSVAREGDFVGALKAYRWFEDEWYDYSPRKAADVMELAPEDYEVDEERAALLLRRLPPGMPVAARDVL
jgi:hypothetical protein